MKPRIKEFIFPAITTLTVSAFPAVFLYCQNADEADFSEVLPILLIFLGTGIILLLLASVLTRSVEKSAFIVSLFMLLLTNFGFIENAMKLVFPKLKYWHTVPIALVFGLHIAYLICCFLNQELVVDIIKTLCLVFGSLILFNTVTSMPQIINYIEAQHQLQEIKEAQIKQQGNTVIDMPNVYLLIFDEYANFPQLEQYYNYDNAPLRGFLEEHNFSISFTSHNESIASDTIQTNLVNLDYIVDNLTSPSEKAVLRKNGVLFSLMRENGYHVQIFEMSDFYGGKLPSVNGTTFSTSGAVTINGETLRDLLLQQSIIYPILQSTKEGDLSILRNRVTITADYLSDPTNLPDGGVFTLAYFAFPHQPFFVDENGQPNPIEHWEDWEDNRYYLGQLKYATKQMLRILENIVSNDPNAIIILQSDHGARSGPGTNAKQKFPLESMDNPLNTVYYQGRFLEIEGLSSVNTLRTVCNELFGLNYEMLKVPEGITLYYRWGGESLKQIYTTRS